MFVILLTANFKFRNRSRCSKGPMKRAGKVCGDSQDLNHLERAFNSLHNIRDNLTVILATLKTSKHTESHPNANIRSTPTEVIFDLLMGGVRGGYKIHNIHIPHAYIHIIQIHSYKVKNEEEQLKNTAF